ncbi:MAG: HAMP domain-containing protein [Okeania sp. SIO3B5]|uniref:methyl-accepting chemotaxis protein n=1 Tax=Okeania sp. SIO3B5 TaxID=2607811 RepID=UPI0014015BFD|nr:HAMP domain-containing protein [Okeania sp. SIO3B5]NEO53993.1 HAMP domain-containing protein [Okeania sp. SIO3B5]
MSNTKIQLILKLKKIFSRHYSNFPLKQKISLPFLSVFLTIWFIGNFGIIYYFSQDIEQRQLKEVEGIAGLVMQELERQMNKLYLNAKLLVGGTTMSKALETGNKTEILKKIIPLKASLSLDIVKVIDKNGNSIIDLRNPTLNQVKISDRVVISQIINGVAFSSMITGKEFNNSRSILIGATPIKSNQGVIGGIIIGTAINNQLLDEISTETNKYIVAFQNKEIIASSLPGNENFFWDKIHAKHDKKSNKIKIDDQLYIVKNINLLGLDGTKLELTALSPLADLEETKQKLVMIISLFSSLGAGIVILVGYSLSNVIASRIATVTSATKKLAESDLKMRLPVTYNDEIDKLAEGFNFMAQQLEERELKIKLKVQNLEETLEKFVSTEETLD